MELHDIESIQDTNGYRILLYCIHSIPMSCKCNEEQLYENTCVALQMVKKKNDDLLLVKLLHDSEQFKYFDDIYRPEITGPITLFAVNNQGIPLVSVKIDDNLSMFSAITSLCTTCNLKSIQESTLVNRLQSKPKDNQAEQSVLCNSVNVSKSSTELPTDITNRENNCHEHITSTKLRIRLPTGTSVEQEFDNHAQLQEVWVSISVKFGIKDFDLKTYNHPIFSEEDYGRTLKELDLCPSGQIFVINKTERQFTNSSLMPATIRLIVSRITTLSISTFKYIQGLLIFYWNYFVQPTNRRPRIDGSATGIQKDSESGSHKKPGRSSVQSNSKRYVSKSFGSNIHTLRSNRDSDDENNSYNGNSTQQK